ncbi:hypothetical protein GF325_10090 [Candidatus Bathyarchaeota archaeon]|nr:hypothetical protein [Candidatus Bathyarchaeota archaeon]
MVQIHIGFDTSQKPRGRLDTNYKTLQQVVEAEGFACWEYSAFPITRESLQNYDILVFPCTDFSKFGPEEINDITQWVKEDGGGLLLLSHAGGDRGRRTNMSDLSSQFAMVFENDQVLDEMHNFGINNLPEITQFPAESPITDDISSICYRAGCSITITGMADQVANANMDAQPQNATVIASAKAGEGRVVCIGSYEIFRDEIVGGINQPFHAQLAKNLFRWLTTEKRRALRESGYGKERAGSPATASNPSSEGTRGSNTEQLVQINSVHDLFLEVKNILNDLDLLRARVLNIYEVTAALDSASQGTGESTPEPASTESKSTSSGKAPAPEMQDEQDGPVTQEDLLSLINATSKDSSHSDISKEPATSNPPASGSRNVSMGDLLSELKSEQETRNGDEGSGRNLDDLQISQPGLGKVAPDVDMNAGKKKAKKDYTYKLSAADKRKSRDDLDDSIDKLEAKLKSLENLKDFKTRQFQDGKISEEDYAKEIEKFERDIQKTKSKMKAYKELIETK